MRPTFWVVVADYGAAACLCTSTERGKRGFLAEEVPFSTSITILTLTHHSWWHWFENVTLVHILWRAGIFLWNYFPRSSTVGAFAPAVHLFQFHHFGNENVFWWRECFRQRECFLVMRMFFWQWECFWWWECFSVTNKTKIWIMDKAWGPTSILIWLSFLFYWNFTISFFQASKVESGIQDWYFIYFIVNDHCWSWPVRAWWQWQPGHKREQCFDFDE